MTLETKPSQTLIENKIAASSVGGKTAEVIRRREELEAREARHNKLEFIEFCSDVLTQHKNADRGNDLPDGKQKHKVL